MVGAKAESPLSRLVRHVKNWGVDVTVDTMLRRGAQSALGDLLRSARDPSMTELVRAADHFGNSASELLGRWFPEAWAEQGRAIVDEFHALRDELEGRYRRQPEGLMPRRYAVEEQTSLLLYGLTRLFRPGVVVETGVANGQSSFYFLRALRTNGGGELHSLDIAPDVGGLLDDSERKDWQLHVIEPTPAQLERCLTSLPVADVFIHDSNHSYLWQRRELELARPRVRAGGFIGCDDAELSHGFLDFCRDEGLKPSMLFDQRKVFGLLRLPA